MLFHLAGGAAPAGASAGRAGTASSPIGAGKAHRSHRGAQARKLLRHERRRDRLRRRARARRAHRKVPKAPRPIALGAPRTPQHASFFGTSDPLAALSTPATGNAVVVSRRDDDDELISAPVISGLEQAGEILTVSDGVWTTTPSWVNYQWYACWGYDCTAIDGETSSTYTPTDANVSQWMAVEVQTSEGTAWTPLFGWINAGQPANLTRPSISGAMRAGRTLTLNPGTWLHQEPWLDYVGSWQRCPETDSDDIDCTVVDTSYFSSSNDRPTYKATPGDVDSVIRVRVHVSNETGDAEASSDATATIGEAVLEAPQADGSLTLDGGAIVAEGHWITSSAPDWGEATAPLRLRYTWKRCDEIGDACETVEGANARDYLPTGDDVGHTFRLHLVATNDAGSDSVDSAATAPVASQDAPAMSEAPSLYGVATEGFELHFSPGVWSDVDTSSFEWQSCSSDLSECEAISEGDHPDRDLTVPHELAGRRIRVEITVSNVHGSATATTDPSDVIAALYPPEITTAPAVVGTPVYGQYVATSAGTVTGTAPVTVVKHLLRCDGDGDNCVDRGVVSPAMWYSNDDVDHTFRIRTTATNAQGTVTVASAPSPAVRGIAPTSAGPPSLYVLWYDTPQPGRMLFIEDGGWYGTSFTNSYQWERCAATTDDCTVIANDPVPSVHALTVDDLGFRLRVTMTATNSTGTASAQSAMSDVVVPESAPTNDNPPAISGDAVVDATLWASSGDWSPWSATLQFAYQWQRCIGGSCTDIAGATNADYQAVAADEDATLRVVVHGTNTAGGTTSTSEETAAVQAATAPVSTSPPGIWGDAAIGQYLEPDFGGWTAYGDVTYAATWLRCDENGDDCTDLQDVTDEQWELTVGPGLAGSTIRLRVTVTNGVGSTVATSDPTGAIVAVPPPTSTAPPTISGRPIDGETLVADPGTWDGPEDLTLAYQWRRCDAAGTTCTDIEGADSDQHVVTADDNGHTLLVRVTGQSVAGDTSADSDPTALAHAPGIPAITGTPTLDGDAAPGSTLTLGLTGVAWTGEDPLEISYAWDRCLPGQGDDTCEPIDGADGTTYDVTADDVSWELRARVVVTNDYGQAVAATARTALVDSPGPVNTEPPSISGTVQVGSTLTGAAGTWSGSPTLAYSWERCDRDGEDCTTLDADEQTYTPTDEDAGSALRVAVTATGPDGATQARSALTTAVVKPGALDIVTAPEVSGSLATGDVLHATGGTWTATASLAYAWLRCDLDGGACVAISGATGDAYTLTAGDVDHTLRVLVTATGTSATGRAQSPPTGAVDDTAGLADGTFALSADRTRLVSIVDDGTATDIATCSPSPCTFGALAVSHDAEHAAVVTGSSVLLVDLATGVTTHLADPPGTTIEGITYAPDDASVVVTVHTAADGLELYEITIASGAVSALAAADGNQLDGALDGSGTDLVYVDDFDGGRIVLAKADGSEPDPVTLPASIHDPRHPRLSPDGNAVAFDARQGSGTDRDVLLLNRASNKVETLAHSSSDEGQPQWSRDGKRVAWRRHDTDGTTAFEQRTLGLAGAPAEVVATTTDAYASYSWPTATGLATDLDLTGIDGDVIGGDSVATRFTVRGSAGAASLRVTRRDGEQLVNETFDCTPQCATTRTVDATLDTSGWPEGVTQVLMVAHDADGRTWRKDARIVIDRTAPDVPTEIQTGDTSFTYVGPDDPDLPGGTSPAGIATEQYRVRLYRDIGAEDWSDWQDVSTSAVPADADDQEVGDGTDYSAGDLVPPGTANETIPRADVQMRLVDRAGNSRMSQVFVIRPHIPQYSNNLLAASANWPKLLQQATPSPGGDPAPSLVRPTTASSAAELRDATADGGVARAWEDGQSMQTPWGELTLAPTDGRHVIGNLAPDGGGISYNLIAPETDGVIRPTPTGMRTLTVLRSAAAPERFTWDVHLDGGQHLVTLADGRVAILAGSDANVGPAVTATVARDGSGALDSVAEQLDRADAALAAAGRSIVADDALIAVFDAPWAVDADGTPIKTRYEVAGDRITLVVEHHSTTAHYPVLADPDLIDCEGRPGPCGTYNGRAAAKYAHKYATSYNDAYFGRYGNDCTNFASQVLGAGGMQFMREFKHGTGSWWYRSHDALGLRIGQDQTDSWSKVAVLLQHLTDYRLDEVVAIGHDGDIDYSKFRPGDLLFFDWIKKDHEIDHVAIVDGITRHGMPTISQHTVDRRGVPWTHGPGVSPGAKTYRDNIKSGDPLGAVVMLVRPVHTAANIK